MRCPACGADETRRLRRFTVAVAAQHFVPEQRHPERHARLRTYLAGLWAQDHVAVEECGRCGFGFAVPWVGGDETFYALAHDADPHYPADRWEFGHTLAALARLDRPLRLAEVGAGHGAFLDRLASLGDQASVVAADFDDGAVATLRAKGYDASRGSLGEIARKGPFDVVCMFQTLEHIADLDAVFDDLRASLSTAGSVFISVPNADATRLQEELTGYWDMPPNHVGRWTPEAIRLAAQRRGFTVEVALQPVRTWETTWQLAVSSVNGRTYRPDSLESRINAIGSRPVRGVLKRLVALSHVPRLAVRRRRYRPLSFWAHLRLQS